MSLEGVENIEEIIEFADEVLEADPPASTIQEAAFDQFIDQMLSEPIIEIFDAKSHPQSPHSPTTLIVATPPRKNNKRKKSSSSPSSSDEENSITDELPSLYSHFKSISLEAPVRFAQAFTIAVNASDNTILSHCFNEIFTPDAQIFKHVYNVKNFTEKKRPLNHFGNYDTAQLSLPQYLEYSKNFAVVSPDFTMDIGNHRVCYEKECSIYMSMFTFNGTIISQDSNIASTDKDGKVTTIKDTESDSAIVPCSKPYAAVGSMAMFRNPQGKIFRLEFFYEFTQ